MSGVQGDAIAQIVFIQRVGGSPSNFVARLRLNERNPAGTYLLHQTSTVAITDAVTRPFAAMTVSSASTAKVMGGLAFALGAVFDITPRIAAFKFAKRALSHTHSPILTESSVGTRAADALTLLLPPGSLDVAVCNLEGQPNTF